MRYVVLILLAVMCTFKLFLSYKGLNQPEAMDQAQIARSVANGNGFITKFYRPVELQKIKSKDETQGIDFNHYRDVNHAPLNIISMAVALKVTGNSDFVAARIPIDENGEPSQNLYGADRAISAVSCFYFFIAMVLAYLLIARMFDEIVAAASICCMAVSELALDYAVSGLPQPLMLCCMLAGLHFLLNAKKALDATDAVGVTLHLGVSFVFMALMCLSGWLSVWVYVGYIVFCAAYFRPYGMYGGVGVGVLVLFSAYSLWSNNQACGSYLGNAFYGIFDCFGGSTEDALRSVSASVASLDSSWLVLRFFGAVFSQVKSLYVNMCSIIVAPFFFLALFYRYKRGGVQCIKWAVFSMWCFASMGMTLYGTDTPLSSGQLAILFAPLFAAFGFSLLFNFMARLNSRYITFGQLRGVSILGIVLLCAGGFVASFPNDLYRGVWLKEKGAPHYPPYYPPALNCKLVDVTNPDDVLMTDMPWAVAWYADRRAIWLPKNLDDYKKINEEILPGSAVVVQGILMTPLSYDPIIPSAYSPTNYMKHGRPGGLAAVSEVSGAFAPLALNLPLAMMDPRRAMFINNFAPVANSQNPDQFQLGEIVNISNTGSNAQFDDIVMMNAGAAVLYKKRGQ